MMDVVSCCRKWGTRQWWLRPSMRGLCRRVGVRNITRKRAGCKITCSVFVLCCSTTAFEPTRTRHLAGITSTTRQRQLPGMIRERRSLLRKRMKSKTGFFHFGFSACSLVQESWLKIQIRIQRTIEWIPVCPVFLMVCSTLKRHWRETLKR